MMRIRSVQLPAFAALALLVSMIVLSQDFGATWDERFQQKYGERVWDYLHGRRDLSEFAPAPGNEYLYGGGVEVLAVAVQRVFPRADVFVLRHRIVSVFGWAGIVFAGLLAARLFGARAGWLAALLLALAPRYFGDAMNNSKDIPFAAAAIATIYYTLTIRADPPYVTWAHAAKLATAITVAINIRPLGLMLLTYSASVILATSLVRALGDGRREAWRTFGVTTMTIAAVALAAIAAGTFAWPWAQAHPLARPLEAFSFVSRLDWAREFPTLYRGQWTAASDLPWHYVLVWIGIGLPPVVLVGLALSPLIAWRDDARRAAVAALAAFVIAPVIAAIVQHATLYDGIRHLTFVIPPLVVLSAIGWIAAIDRVRQRLRALAVAALVVGAAEPFIFAVRNHPNQTVYFSPLAGGPRAAFTRYEMDYWGNSMLQALEFAAALAERSHAAIVVSGNPLEIVQADATRFRSLAVVPRSRRTYQLDIRLLRGPADSIREFVSRGDVVHTIRTADGTPLCIVLPGPAYETLQRQLARFE